MCVEGFRQRASRPDTVEDVVHDALEDWIGNPPSQDVQRLDQRHSRLQQRCQLLIEDNEFPGGNLPAFWERRQPQPGKRTAASLLYPEDEQTFLLELAAQPRFVLGDVDALDNVAARSSEPAPIFH